MHLIDERLHLGNLQDARNTDLLKKSQITHILTLDVEPLSAESAEQFTVKFVRMEDSETEDILKNIEECLEFIKTGTENGKILVHCHAGVSRSVAIVAAFLMRKYSLKLVEAEEKIQKQKSDISINSGFIHQLLIFETMNGNIDLNHPAYKAHRFRMLRHEIASSGRTQLLPAYIANNPVQPKVSGESSYIYKCKKCRKPVFEESNIYPHEIDETKAFRPQNLEANFPVNCSSFFLEPIKWMEGTIISNLSGRLDCPKCSFRLGRFNWSGARCSCGKWVTPALQIHASNVDRTAVSL